MNGSYDYDVIVVGTGYGGASAADSLARAGLKVGILERGTWWGGFEGHRSLPETLPQLAAALARLNLSGFGRGLSVPLLRYGLLELSLHNGTIVVNSSAVGGNSVVSGAYLHRPAPQFYDALPPELTVDELAPHYERIERALGVAPGPQDQRRLAALTALADREHWTIGPTPQAIRWTSDDPASKPPCTNCNRCMFSCNVGAKQGMDRTLIPNAIKAGAVLRDLCTVRTIEPVSGGYEVRFQDGHQRRPAVLRARRVVLAAGTLNTLKILLRSTVIGGLGPIPNLGQRFSMAGDWVAFYRGPRDSAPDKVNGHIMDSQIRVPGSETPFDHQILIPTSPLIPGSWLLRNLQRHTIPLFGFGPDEMDGEVSWKGRSMVVRHKPQAVVSRLQASLDRIAQTLGRKKPPRQADSGKRVRPWLSFHPLGGCCMATDASRGVVDFRGQVFGHPGLYVADASMLPTMTIAGPQLSISALASWVAERIVKDAA
jgi:cholesterol oxidase